MSSSSNALSPLEALKAGFRRACVRRLVGDEPGAIQVLKEEIPVLVVSWAKVSRLEPAEKKAKLKEMFDDESGRADELATAFDLFAGRFEARLAGVMREELGNMVSHMKSLLEEVSLAPHVSSKEKPKKTEVQTTEKKPVVIPENQTPIEAEPEKDNNLDPPRGMGLKFDEIEKMIDEVLAFES
ncbi:MAG: hypothetical protein P8N49_04605 [Opitutales bacterium]|nr:hypothetical protein [Opitutales bacterium]